LATPEEVETKLQELIARLASSDDAARSLGRSLPERRVLTIHVTDLDADWWTTIEGGLLGTLRVGRPESADIHVAAASDDLVHLIDGQGSLFSAYLAGRVRIEASFSDLLRLRKLV
jgi:predicted lipid carrier protein YhbT